MALSLALHGLALLLLFAAGAAGGSTEQEPALFVELALVAPAPSPADEPAPSEPETAIELAPPDEPPPVDLSALKPVELPEPEPPPPPVDISELKPAEPPKPAPPQPPKPVQQKRPSAKAAVTRHPPARNVSRAGDAQQAAAGFLPTPAIVWEGKPRFRQPPTPAVYPSRAIELNQQGEVLVRVRLDPQGSAVEVVIVRSSGFALLDRSALKAVRGWRFLPAVRDGRPVAAWVEIPVRFQLR